MKNPFTTRKALNKSNGKDATIYYNRDGTYVSVENESGLVIQVSDKTASVWHPDSSIIDPYIP